MGLEKLLKDLGRSVPRTQSILYTGLQIKVFRTGERLVDAIDFEELSLKAVDPSLGPKILRWRGKEKDSEKLEVGRAENADPILNLGRYPYYILRRYKVTILLLQI